MVIPKCPHCRSVLKKPPSRKTKCPFCKEDIYVRTLVKCRSRVSVTKEEAEKIDTEWRNRNATSLRIYLDKDEECSIESEKTVLRDRFNCEPTENDILWAISNMSMIRHAKNMNYGLYRNVRVRMGEILRRENKYYDALTTFLEVAYLDINGPRNAGSCKDYPELLKEYPCFNIENSRIIPIMIEIVKELIRETGLSKEDVRKLFIKHNKKLFDCFAMAISPEEIFPRLEEEICT